jgi:hypothetical protein
MPGVQVVVEQPQFRVARTAGAVDRRGELGGVGAQQVVHREPAGCVLLGEVRAAEFAQRRVRVRRRHQREAGGRGDAGVGSRVHAEQPEHPPPGRGQVVVRPGEHRARRGARVPGVQLVEPADAQLFGLRGQREAGMGGRVRGGHADRERQPGAQPDEVRGGARLALDAHRPEAAGEEPDRLAVGERGEREDPGALGDQPGEFVSAGDDHEAAGAAGDQRPYLLDLVRVVQDDQQASARDHGPVERRLGIEIRRNGGGADPKRLKETAQRGGRVERLPARVEAAQVDVQLSVGEAGGCPLAEVVRQRRLAHPSGPGDHHDLCPADLRRVRAAGARDVPVGGPARLGAHRQVRERVEGGEFRGPAGEVRRHHGHLARRRLPVRQVCLIAARNLTAAVPGGDGDPLPQLEQQLGGQIVRLEHAGQAADGPPGRHRLPVQPARPLGLAVEGGISRIRSDGGCFPLKLAVGQAGRIHHPAQLNKEIPFPRPKTFRERLPSRIATRHP